MDEKTPFLLYGLNEERRAEYWASLALRHSRGIGPRLACRLLKSFGSAYRALEKVRQGAKAPGVPQEALSVLRQESWRESARLEWNAAGCVLADVVLWSDAAYPERLRELPDAPVLLYAKGDLSLLHSPSIGVVGTRKCSPRGKRDAMALAGNLSASGVTVVSGMARGVDAVAHRAALPLPGGTIAVLGSGVDVVYPLENQEIYAEIVKRGLVISEFAPGAKPEPRNFPIRNRLISGLSLGILVVEASPGSGSLITAHCALEQNRAVYAVGGQIGEEQCLGCQELIRQGAVPVFSHLDVLRDLQGLLNQSCNVSLAFSLPPKHVQTAAPPPDRGAPLQENAVSAGVPSTKSPSETPCSDAKVEPCDVGSRLLVALTREGPSDVDTLCELLSLEPSEASAGLVLLEVRGAVVRRADNLYAAV